VIGLASACLLLVSTACGDGDDGVGLPVPTGTYEDGTVTAMLVADGRFDALVSLFETAKVFMGPPGAEQVIGNAAEVAGGPDWDHTVFAPTDEAFSRLEQHTLDCMFEEANATMSVRVHVVPQVLNSDMFRTGEVLTIGGPVAMLVDGRNASFAEAGILETDIEATNGVIHVIDAVNVPSVCEG